MRRRRRGGDEVVVLPSWLKKLQPQASEGGMHGMKLGALTLGSGLRGSGAQGQSLRG